jgi:phage-related baseplate assembly protein
MSDDPVLAEKDVDTVLAEALALYKATTGVTLAPADPRRLHLYALLLIIVQQRGLIDFSGKQSLLRFVSDEWIDELAPLWGEERLEALPSTCTQRFNFASVGSYTIPAGKRVTDGTNVWQVTEDTSATDDHVDAEVECTETGDSSNGVAAGQIDTLVDPITGCTSTENTTITISGRDSEGLEAFRERLRDAPENRSTCGPRTAYRAQALEASASVADAVALGPDDGGDMAGYPPGTCEVFILVIKGERDADGVLESVVPEPDDGLLEEVDEACSAEDVRPLTDSVTVKAPEWRDFDCIATYYIARSRSKSAASIQTAVEEAFDAFLLWQQSAIGRDINPSELTTRLVNAGAKRVVVTDPAFAELARDEAARLSYSHLAYGGVEDD